MPNTRSPARDCFAVPSISANTHDPSVRLVTRWRLANGELPLANRHLRALAARTVDGLTPEFVAWVKQQVENKLAPAAQEHKDGVLMTVLTKNGNAVTSVGPYKALATPDARTLQCRATQAYKEAQHTGIAPETLASIVQDTVVFKLDKEAAPSGMLSLVIDLLQTQHIPYRFDSAAKPFNDSQSSSARPNKSSATKADLQGHPAQAQANDDIFLISDEHGIVCATNNALAHTLKQQVERLYHADC